VLLIASKKTLLSWSSGKDSAYALQLLQKDPGMLLGLFTTINQEFERVAMHAVRLDLLKKQAYQIGLPLEIIEIPNPCSKEKYEVIMQGFIERCKFNKVEAIAFGDLYLEDVRSYREQQMQDSGIDCLFPCWGINTTEFSKSIIDLGIKAKISCLDPRFLDDSLAGHEYNKGFLEKLPITVDPCGENGEFHTFVYDSPSFAEPIRIQQGVTLKRDKFVFTDWVQRD